MEQRIDRKDYEFASAAELEKKDREYWRNASVKEKLQTICYLRESFYGPEATTGRLQRVYSFSKKPAQ